MANLKCGRISIRPYDARKRPHTKPMTSFLCIYTYACERPDNTRVGANCN